MNVRRTQTHKNTGLRFGKNVGLVVLLVGAWMQSSAQASGGIPSERNRYFNHGQMRLVEPKIENKRIILYWRSPSGRRYRYEPYRHHRGWLIRLRRAIQDNVRYVGVGGRFKLTSPTGGRVWIRLVRRVRRVFRGVRPVKIDGRMPIFIATVLPRHQNDRIYVYKLWGQVNLYQSRYFNQLVCLYGEWYDFQGRSLGLVSQILGLKGKALRPFSEQYRVPTDRWNQLWKRRKKLLLYQEAWRVGQSPKLPSDIVPTLTQKQTDTYYNECKQRLMPWQRHSATILDPLYQTPIYRPAFFPFLMPYHLFGLPETPKTGRNSPAYWSTKDSHKITSSRTILE